MRTSSVAPLPLLSRPARSSTSPLRLMPAVSSTTPSASASRPSLLIRPIRPPLLPAPVVRACSRAPPPAPSPSNRRSAPAARLMPASWLPSARSVPAMSSRPLSACSVICWALSAAPAGSVWSPARLRTVTAPANGAAAGAAAPLVWALAGLLSKPDNWARSTAVRLSRLICAPPAVPPVPRSTPFSTSAPWVAANTSRPPSAPPLALTSSCAAATWPALPASTSWPMSASALRLPPGVCTSTPSKLRAAPATLSLAPASKRRSALVARSSSRPEGNCTLLATLMTAAVTLSAPPSGAGVAAAAPLPASTVSTVSTALLVSKRAAPAALR